MSAYSQPSPEAGVYPHSSQPVLTVVPPPARRSSVRLDAEQRLDLKTVMLRCLAAQKPEHAGPLAAQGITAAFVATLLDRARAISTTEDGTVHHGSQTQTATRALVNSLRGLQAAGRQIHQGTRLERRAEHPNGGEITTGRATLDRSAQAILHQASQERGPGVDTDVIERVQGELTAVGQAGQAQEDERLAAQSLRAQTVAAVEAIKTDCRKILFAADRAWPHKDPAHAAVRVKFQLPRRHVYTHWTN